MMGNTFHQRLEYIYTAYPDKTALHLLFARKPEQQLTYRQLLHRSARVSAVLQDAGIEPGEVVILILQHSQELILSFFGAILSGAVPSIMPFLTEKLLPDQYRSSLEALFKITRPAAVITYADFQSDVVKSAAGSSIRKILIAEEMFTAFFTDSVHEDQPVDFSNLSGAQCQPEDIVLLQHSSGTTGLQKGVALSHQAVFNQLANYSQSLAFSPEDVVISWLPLYHDMGLIAGFPDAAASVRHVSANVALRLGARPLPFVSGDHDLSRNIMLAAKFRLQFLRPKNPRA